MGIFTFNESFWSHIWGMISGYRDFLSGEEPWLHRMDRHKNPRALSFYLPSGLVHHLDLVLVLLRAF